MTDDAEAVPDAAPSTPYGKKKVWKKTSTKTFAKQDLTPKGSIPELKGHYFLTTEDDPNTSQDHYRTSMEAIGRYMYRKAEGSQDLMEFFDYGRIPTLELPEEPAMDATRTEEALWNIKLKSYAKRQTRLEQNMITIYSIMLGQCRSDM